LATRAAAPATVVTRTVAVDTGDDPERGGRMCRQCGGRIGLQPAASTV
jgi:hypothetical protein